MNLTSFQLRDIIIRLLCDPDNKLGGKVLGTYTYESGFVDPAVSVGDPLDDIKVEGLECILPLFPDTHSEWTTASVHSEETWDILLIQRTPPEGQSVTLCAAVDRLRRFLVTSDGVYTPQDQILGSYPQYRLTFMRPDLHPIINQVVQLCT